MNDVPKSIAEARAALRSGRPTHIFKTKDGAPVVCSGGIRDTDLIELTRAEATRILVTNSYQRAPWVLWDRWCLRDGRPFVVVKCLRGHVVALHVRAPKSLSADDASRVATVLRLASRGRAESDRRGGFAVVPRNVAVETAELLVRLLGEQPRARHPRLGRSLGPS
jgi:hypothetical protein